MTAKDPINPPHYKGFANGAQVIDITEGLSFAGGNDDGVGAFACCPYVEDCLHDGLVCGAVHVGGGDVLDGGGDGVVVHHHGAEDGLFGLWVVGEVVVHV